MNNPTTLKHDMRAKLSQGGKIFQIMQGLL